MKTIFALIFFGLVAASSAQSIHDLEREKVRMRTTLLRFMPTGVLCAGVPLVRLKNGREEPDKSSPTASRDPFAARGPEEGAKIIVIDLSMQTMKAKEQRDLTLYPVALSLSGRPATYAYAASNALLARQGRFSLVITAALVQRMGFEAHLVSTGPGQVNMSPVDFAAWEVPTSERLSDPFSKPSIAITLIGSTQAPRTWLYPTAIPGTYALSAAEAWKTWAKP